ncbi:MAG: hypothetical protein HZB13_20500 [Acidobacteria bacterium]|nr:hypothetical protein [Acidobacteriota bacterium]
MIRREAHRPVGSWTLGAWGRWPSERMGPHSLALGSSVAATQAVLWMT